MEDLIRRIEAADGPSRELDWLIAEALGKVPEHSIQEVGFHYGWWRKSGEFSLRRAMDSSGRTIESWRPKPRTSSIDAAMTLVPDSAHVTITMDGEFWLACVNGFLSRSKYLALALCAAALRARNG